MTFFKKTTSILIAFTIAFAMFSLTEIGFAETENAGDQTEPEHTVSFSIKNGTIKGDTLINEGETKKYTIRPDIGYKVKAIKVNGVSIEPKGGRQVIEVTCVKDDILISVTTAIKKYKIRSSTVTSPGSMKGGTITPSKTVSYGTNVTYMIKPKTGFSVKDVKVDGESVGSVKKYTFKNIKAKHKIVAVFKKTSVFIMLDAGHIGRYNKYTALSGKKYYESQMAWRLHKYLKAYLQRYEGAAVGTTRPSMYTDMDVEARGRKAKGYDLFLSIHSNWCCSSCADYPLVIRQYKSNASQIRLANNFVKTIRNTMNTKQAGKVWTRTYKSGGRTYDWYGVLRSSKAAGCNGYILEHSFHSNKRIAKWLYSASNLKRMAKAEAEVIADYYGLDYAKRSTPSKKIKKKTKYPHKIKLTANVYVYSGVGTSHRKLGTLKKGKVYTVIRTSAKGKWGRLTCKNGGWIPLKNAVAASKFSKIMTYKIKSAVPNLNTRKGPGTSYARVSTIKNNNKLYKINKESKNGKWGKLYGKKRWIRLSFAKRKY